MANFIVGALVGLVLGFLIAYRTVTEMLNELDENDKEENTDGTESKSDKTQTMANWRGL